VDGQHRKKDVLKRKPFEHCQRSLALIHGKEAVSETRKKELGISNESHLWSRDLN